MLGSGPNLAGRGLEQDLTASWRSIRWCKEKSFQPDGRLPWLRCLPLEGELVEQGCGEWLSKGHWARDVSPLDQGMAYYNVSNRPEYWKLATQRKRVNLIIFNYKRRKIILISWDFSEKCFPVGILDIFKETIVNNFYLKHFLI